MSRPKRFTNTQSLKKSKKEEAKLFIQPTKPQKDQSGDLKKETKAASKKQQFPNILRIFTERIFWSFFTTGIFLFILVVVSMHLTQVWQQRQKIEIQRQQLQAQSELWGNILQKYPGYRDGYIRLAMLSYQLGDPKKANVYLNQALALDPGFEPTRVLEQIVQAQERTL